MTRSDPGGRARDEERCAHCGLPLSRARARRRPEAPVARFCCAGCSVAHALGGEEGSAADALGARLALSAFLAMGVMVFSLSLYGEHLADGTTEADGEGAAALQGLFRLGALALATPVMWLLAMPLAVAVVRSRRLLSADALVLAGTASAYGISVWHAFAGGGEVYFETATMVIVLFALGRFLDVRARERAHAELERALPDALKPVTVVRGAVEHELPPAQVARGDVVRVRPGDVLPVDGLVLEGRSFLDSASLTGEAEPQSVGPGARVLAGTSALDGTLLVRAEKVGAERARDAIERLLAESLGRRARYVRIADRLASFLLPLVLATALATAAFHWERLGPSGAMMAALAVVLISCPCALGIATPLAFWVALARASRLGVLVRGGDALERLARVRQVFFDKTGTLTDDELDLVEVRCDGSLDPDQALRLAAAIELASEHPIGRSLRRAYLARAELSALPPVGGFRALPGVGVEALLGGVPHRVARAASAPDDSVTRVELSRGGTALPPENRPPTTLAVFELSARTRPEARAVVDALQHDGLGVSVLTGDAPGPAALVAAELGIPVEAGLLPADKVARVRAAGGRSLFVGDGLNDAAALAAADVGVVVEGGAPLSAQTAEIALLVPGLAPLPELVRLARRAVRVARQNLAWAFGYNAIGLAFAASGRLNPILAAAAMVASSAAVVLNSRRLAVSEPVLRRSLLDAREGEHRDLGVPQHGLGHAAQREVPEAGAAVGR